MKFLNKLIRILPGCKKPSKVNCLQLKSIERYGSACLMAFTRILYMVLFSMSRSMPRSIIIY